MVRTPEWLSIKQKPKKGKLSTRTIVKKHLKEWNFDKESEEMIKERRKVIGYATDKEIKDFWENYRDYNGGED